MKNEKAFRCYRNRRSSWRTCQSIPACWYPVVPVTRHMDIIAEAKEILDPLMVVLGLEEKDFSSVLKTIPDGWRDRLVFIKNELLLQDWEVHGIENYVSKNL